MLVNYAMLKDISEYDEDDRPIYWCNTEREQHFEDTFSLKSFSAMRDLPEWIGKTIRIVRAERLRLPSPGEIAEYHFYTRKDM